MVTINMKEQATHEFRVVWQREGKVQRIHRYATKQGAERRLSILTSDNPFPALGVNPDDRVCCGGDMCGCGGLTYRERHEVLKRDLPSLLYARIEQRTIGAWQAA